VLRQLKNKIINYIHQVRGRPHRVCNICNTRQTANESECSKCGSRLRLPSIIVSETFETLHVSGVSNCLEDIANKQLVTKLLSSVKDSDPKTYKIIQLMLEGRSKSEISREINLAQNAMNNRIKKCRKILKYYLMEKESLL
jgi:DNA-directed RNA polymerase specialized sigma24 family protein